jgi:hypothetical protein
LVAEMQQCRRGVYEIRQGVGRKCQGCWCKFGRAEKRDGAPEEIRTCDWISGEVETGVLRCWLNRLRAANFGFQIYHTKLEQLMTLTNKLSGLSRTLGSEFYQTDIVEPAPAPGENPNDPGANRDVTPERFSKLEKELVRGKGEVVSGLILTTPVL